MSRFLINPANPLLLDNSIYELRETCLHIQLLHDSMAKEVAREDRSNKSFVLLEAILHT